ncbi:MAG: DUF1257 domain-containing protein [Planctomycetota bacterium]|nr:MAG: DUF1257 domain-containing protein [Planctomycetota bacterium]REK25965.1 MAG: DUF1257 domain-containing protein [Planctomycetota bacterium]REK46919.1 MAG: DUF1257 domain-containing protein [Planctomycetota bacterium]
MSHFTSIHTRLVDKSALVAALSDVGFDDVEVHDQAQQLYGYRGDKRRQTAEVIIRRQYVGSASNDIGFRRRDDGAFDAIISEYDRSKYGPKWIERLTQRYAYHVTRHQLNEQRFDVVKEEIQADGKIHLSLRRMI